MATVYRSSIDLGMPLYLHCTMQRSDKLSKFTTQHRQHGIRSKRRQVGSATNKTATGRNGDNLIGDNSVISATDSQNGEKAAQVKTATTIVEEEGREKKRGEEEGRKRITN